jgi:hypothetical protein
MTEQEKGGTEEEYLEREIELDPKIIAQILRSRAERPSAKMIIEAKEIDIDLGKGDVWEIFLFDSLRKVEGYLILDLEGKVVTFHTRVRAEVLPVIGQDLGEIEGRPAIAVEVDEKAPSAVIDLGLGTQRIKAVEKIFSVPAFGHVWFESNVARLDIYHDCQYNFVTKKND